MSTPLLAQLRENVAVAKEAVEHAESTLKQARLRQAEAEREFVDEALKPTYSAPSVGFGTQ